MTIGREGTPPRHVHGRRVQGGEGTVVRVMRTAKHGREEFVAADCVQPARHGAGEGTTTGDRALARTTGEEDREGEGTSG